MTRKQPHRPQAANTGNEEIPPGATARAADRPIHRGRGKPGSGAGPRHAANDEGSPDEEYGATDSNEPLADEAPVPEEQGPPYAGISGGAVGGTPAEGRATGGRMAGGLNPGQGTRPDTTIGSDPDAPAR
jgi:hypothetical protein